jgi:hypothetical protein
MVAVTAAIEVARPARDVFDYATNPSTFREWQKGVVEGHLDTAREVAVGDHCVTVRRIGFANRTSTSERGRPTSSVEHPRPRRTDPRPRRGHRRDHH